MSRKKNNKALVILEPSFSDILVCQDENFRPYVESFFHKPENLTQKNLGLLFGVLEITDKSKDSSYIVNYIISIIKKEFYSNTRRGAIESFESALHKANLALSKLAQHENINWINNIHAIIGIIEKNNLHLSQAGQGMAIIFRTNLAINISEEPDKKDSSSSPLKTFEDIVSGKIQENDKLLISTPEIFDIFSEQEIKKSAQRFSQDKFTRFLKTALSNELERSASLIIDFQTAKKLSPIKKDTKTKEKSPANFFSQKTFENKHITKKEEPAQKNKKIVFEEELTPKSPQQNHLYIKEGLEDLPPTNPESFNFNDFKKSTLSNLQKIAVFFSPKKIPRPKLNQITQRGVLIKKGLINFSQGTASKIKPLFRKTSSSVSPPPEKTNLQTANRKNILSSILPSWKKIITYFKNLTKKQKIFALAILLLVFIVPYFMARIDRNENIPQEASLIIDSPTAPEESSDNVDLTYLEQAQNENQAEKIVLLNDNVFAVEKRKIFDFKNNNFVELPTDFQDIEDASAMDDLNLILLFTQDQKIISFYPDIQKFQSNIINLPENSDLKIAGTYLTYLYLVDQKENQIYRYPRAEGGFGEKINWLKETINLNEYKDATINDNIFILKQDSILKLFKGYQENFSLEEDVLPFAFATREESENLFILDKQNKKILEFDNNGTIIQEFQNQKFGETQQIIVDENNQILYLLLENYKVAQFKY